VVDFAQAHRQFARPTRSALVPSDYFALGGGLDLETPPLEKKPGTLLGCLNYEAKIAGGYESIAGYERYDGRTLPSQAKYWVIAFTGESGSEVALGSTLTSSGGGTGIVLAWVAGVSVVLGRVTGSFPSAGTLTSGAWSATQSGPLSSNNASTDELNETYQLLAIADQRAQVGTVPGEGSVIGVALYRGVAYAVRNVVGSTAAKLFQATASGWTEVALGTKLHFTAGQAAGISAGDTLTGATSTATGTVRRIVINSGTFAGNDAAGFLILSGVTGTFSDAEALKVGGTTRATASGASAAQTLLPNGKYEFLVKNFYGATGDLRLYGCDGVNRAFEFQDGAEGWFAQIETGMPVDTPSHIDEFMGQLWLSFPGGSVQRSAINDPCAWSVILGAAEFGVGDDVTGFLSQVQTLFAFSKSRTMYFLDNGDGTITFKTYNNEIGGETGTMQNVGSGLTLDSRGFSTVATTQKYGAYTSVPVSLLVDTLVKPLIGKATCSAVIRSKGRYRCFFNDGEFISITVSGTKILAFMHCDYGITVRCIASDKDTNENELTIFGDDTGYVYAADSGTSFDSQPIGTFMRLPFYHSHSPGRIKRYRRADFDITSDLGATISIAVDYSYADSAVKGDPTRSIDVISGAGFWGVALWGQFRWSAGFKGKAAIKLEASGENVSFLIASSSATNGQHAVDGVQLSYSNRRLERGSVA
jgi:hypothetical protein